MENLSSIKAWAAEEAARVAPEDRERVRAEYLGAAIADSCFCPSCGARGEIWTCARCSQ